MQTETREHGNDLIQKGFVAGFSINPIAKSGLGILQAIGSSQIIKDLCALIAIIGFCSAVLVWAVILTGAA